MKEQFFDILYKEQKLIVLQLFIFSLLISIVLISGTVTYMKTSIYDQAKIEVEAKEQLHGSFERMKENIVKQQQKKAE